MGTNRLKFLHLADLHLDRPLTHRLMKLPYEKAQVRAREMREVLAKAMELATAERVDLVLIAGDLWEEEGLAPDTVPYVRDVLARATVPVVIAPGNHDYYSRASHYSDGLIAARFGRGWPPNVYIFTEFDFTHWTPPGMDGVVVTGLAYASNQPVGLRRLRERIDFPPSDLKLAVLHGSREQWLTPGKMRTLPFSDAELLAQPFDYAALGHFHSHSVITGPDGRIRGAYPGSTCALSADETGRHGALVGEVEPGGVRPENLKFHPLDPRQVHRLDIDVSGLQHVPEVEERIRSECGRAGVGASDIVNVHLKGTFLQGDRIQLDDAFLSGLAWHIIVDASKLTPEWDLDLAAEPEGKTTEDLFKRKMRELILEAMERGDPDEVQFLQNALFYGLDALHGRSIKMR